MVRRGPVRRGRRRPGGDGVMLAATGLVVAVPLINAMVGLARASSPWLLAAVLAVTAVVVGVTVLATRRRQSP
ncbi:hypothetical protein [Sphaerisporangium corydalis]|uniref:Uncharacterized protein n=1 Tax=Sphaerisporangium corydalis TaxID=1441875 RepID=A0ABV9E979_9ACTN|nr:hypothetical protein [Sphaerisporangium corydalis]